MPRSALNINIEAALLHIKKDVIAAGGSCMLLVVVNEEIMNHGGGDKDRISFLLGLLRDEMDKDPGKFASNNQILPGA
jgi:hypothetical protein